MRRTSLAACVFASFVLSCSKSGDSGTTQPVVSVASVAVSQDATLVPLATVQLSATAKDASGAALSGKTVSWSSSNLAVATVSASGLVTAVAAGTAIITATSDGKSGTVTITVREGGFVGPAGGALSALQGAVKITVPAGALAASTSITVATSTDAVTDPRIVPGAIWEIGPSGTQFAQAATLALTYDPAKVRAIDNQADLRLFTKDATGKWLPLNAAGTGSVDATAHVVSGPLPHLSPFALASTNAVTTINAAAIAALPGTPAFPGNITRGAVVQLLSSTTNAFGQPAAPQGAPQVTSSDQTKVTVSGVAKATGGSQGVTYSLTGVEIGSANITVAADGQSSTFPVAVVAAPTMTIALTSSSVTTPQGTAATGAAQITITKNFTADVTLSYTSPSPQNISASFTPTIVTGGSNSSALSVGVSGFLAPGTYPVTVTAAATSGSVVRASTTYSVTVTPTATTVRLASADVSRPIIAGWMRPKVTMGWTPLACSNNACNVTYDPTSTSISFALVQQLGGGAYHDFIVSVNGDEVPNVPQWLARETRATAVVMWPGSNLPAGYTFTGVVGSEKASATTPSFTLNFSRARTGNQEVMGIQSNQVGIRYYYFNGPTNITGASSLSALDLSVPGISPELRTLTFTDPFNLNGTRSWTSVLANVDGDAFTELYTYPFSGSTALYPTIPLVSLPADRIQGILAALDDLDGSSREVKIFPAIPIDVALQLGPRAGSLTFSQLTFECTTLDFTYARQPEYNLAWKIAQKDLTGLYKLDLLTTYRYNLGAPNVKIQTSDLPSSWCGSNPPNNVEVDFRSTVYGSLGVIPGPNSYLGGPRSGDKWIVATSVRYAF